jgi:hypothetical protein
LLLFLLLFTHMYFPCVTSSSIVAIHIGNCLSVLASLAFSWDVLYRSPHLVDNKIHDKIMDLKLCSYVFTHFLSNVAISIVMVRVHVYVYVCPPTPLIPLHRSRRFLSPFYPPRSSLADFNILFISKTTRNATQHNTRQGTWQLHYVDNHAYIFGSCKRCSPRSFFCVV